MPGRTPLGTGDFGHFYSGRYYYCFLRPLTNNWRVASSSIGHQGCRWRLTAGCHLANAVLLSKLDTQSSKRQELPVIQEFALSASFTQSLSGLFAWKTKEEPQPLRTSVTAGAPALFSSYSVFVRYSPGKARRQAPDEFTISMSLTGRYGLFSSRSTGHISTLQPIHASKPWWYRSYCLILVSYSSQRQRTLSHKWNLWL